MNDDKYIGLGVHQATISAAVLDSAGKLVMEMRTRNESRHHSSVYSRSVWKFACDL